MESSRTVRVSCGDGLPGIVVREAPPLRFPGAEIPASGAVGVTDCNSPAHWDREMLYVINSAAHPWLNAGHDLAHLEEIHRPVEFDNEVSGGRWFESTWKDADGTLYGWYHNEPAGVWPERLPDRRLTAPRIGAARSVDNGLTWEDLGFVLEAPADSLRCDTANFYFAGGNGDFSVLLDPASEFFYFYLGTYHASLSEQGVSVARMAYADRDRPAGKAWKWHRGGWNEPGIGGHVTPIFPAAKEWHGPAPDVFWGPSVHWNTHLGQAVMLLNRAQDPYWAQEGIYVSVTADPGDPEGWSDPVKLLGRDELIRDPAREHGWYPQVMGTDRAGRETDKLAGRTARLFVHGQSRWEISFLRPDE